MKTVYGWVVDWGPVCNPRISIDLFFSNEDEFKKALYYYLDGEEALKRDHDKQLIPIQVPDDFDDLDFIPENY